METPREFLCEIRGLVCRHKYEIRSTFRDLPGESREDILIAYECPDQITALTYLQGDQLRRRPLTE